MNALILAVALFVPTECPQCQHDAAARTGTRGGRPAVSALNCPHATPPVHCYRKPCAGCAGGVCLSCQAPYYGSAPYNYRIAFDYPWSQRPAYPCRTLVEPLLEPGEPEPFFMEPDDPAGAESIPAASKKSRLRR